MYFMKSLQVIASPSVSVTVYHALVHDIYPDPALILSPSNMLYYFRHSHKNSSWKKSLTKQLKC